MAGNQGYPKLEMSEIYYKKRDHPPPPKKNIDILNVDVTKAY